MNCLPIVDRELRVAARKRGNFWLRVAAATTALVIGSGFFLLSQLEGTRSTGMGSALFSVLSWLSLAACLSAGLFFTSDCLSEEKREGTLGLLFLTDLRGYDVVLGKLLATSLRGFYALLATLPILAVTLLMGGITGEQFGKSALALVNALFVSLAAGMAVSVLSRDSQKALCACLFVLLLLGLGGPLADVYVATIKQRSFQPLWSLSSPGYGLIAASLGSNSGFWRALVITHLLGWTMLALAAARVPHSWQQRKQLGARSNRGWAYAWRYGGVRRRERLRRNLLGCQPVAWLTCRECWQSLALWLLAILALAGFVIVLSRTPGRETWILWNYLGGMFTFLLYLWAASQTCRFFVEARRSGLLELLLTAPVSNRQIVSGQWRALLRMFGLPLAMLLGVHAAACGLSQLGFQRIASQVGVVTSSVITNQSSIATRQAISGSTHVTISPNAGTNGAPAAPRFQLTITPRELVMAVAAAATAMLGTVANLLALGWFGMWMGMTSRSANLATLKTLLFVQIVPWFGISFVTGIAVTVLMSGLAFRAAPSQPAAWFAWWPLLSALLTAGLAVAKDIGFIAWSRNKLQRCLREQATLSLGERRRAAPPILSSSRRPVPLRSPRSPLPGSETSDRS